MKFNKIFLIPALAVLASCGGASGPSASEIDAKVNAKVQANSEQAKAQCDEMIKTAAAMRADSTLSKIKGKIPAATVIAVPAKVDPKAVTKPASTSTKVAPVKTEKDKVLDRFGHNNTKAGAAAQIKAEKTKVENRFAPKDSKKEAVKIKEEAKKVESRFTPADKKEAAKEVKEEAKKVMNRFGK
jgi:hypothetical protein